MDGFIGTFKDINKLFTTIEQRNKELLIRCLDGAKSELSKLLKYYNSENTREDIDSLFKLVTEIETKRKADSVGPMVAKGNLIVLENHIKILHIYLTSMNIQEKSQKELWKHYKENQNQQIRQAHYSQYPTDLRTTVINQHHTDHPHQGQLRYKQHQQQRKQQRQLQAKQQIQQHSESHHQYPQQEPGSHPYELPHLECCHQEPQHHPEVHHNEPQQETELNPQEPQLRTELNHPEQQLPQLHHKESQQQSELPHQEPQQRLELHHREPKQRLELHHQKQRQRPESHHREVQQQHKYVQTEQQEQKQKLDGNCFDRKPDMRDGKITDSYEHEKQERDKDCRILELTEQIEHLRTRLSQLSSLKMREGNPNITDLGDSNRPTKLAEYFSELYDNQWTDAFEEMSAQKVNEMEVIEILLKITERSYEYCSATSNEQLSALQRSFQKQIFCPNNNKDDIGRGDSMPYASEQGRDLLPALKELRKTFAPFTLPYLRQAFRLLANKEIYERINNGTSLKVCVDRCVELCWFMCIQDPPMCLEFCRKGDGNTGDFRSYTQTGNTVDFCVWPCVRLYKGGPLMMKGVAQMR